MVISFSKGEGEFCMYTQLMYRYFPFVKSSVMCAVRETSNEPLKENSSFLEIQLKCRWFAQYGS